MKKFIIFLLLITGYHQSTAQSVGIGITTPNSSAILDITSPLNNKGILIPRMTATQRANIPSPANGLMVYETTSNSLWIYNSTSATWVQQSPGVSPWAAASTHIYNTNTGRVGIGTSTPDTSAELDISSTNTGLLIPRMTSAQRLAIPLPARGLLVYETTTNSFWFYNSSVWNQIGTGGASPWVVSGTTIYNSNTGNVGIGTSSPTSKLHVAGNSFLLNGTNPIMQLQQGGVNTGYMQVSGDDIRMGTNSGNGSGKLVIRMDGTDRIYVDSIGQVGIRRSAPAYDLDINGNARIHSTSSGNKSTINMYANPYLAVDPTGYGSSYISFYNWVSLGNNNYDFTSKYKIEFEGGTSERLKFQHVDYDNQFVLRNNGNIGINVLSPAEKLHVSGGNLMVQDVAPLLILKSTSTITSTAEPGIEMRGPTTTFARMQYVNGGLAFNASGTASSQLYLKGGNLGINNTDPQEKLDVLGNAIFDGNNPIIQLQLFDVNKGFVQLNGDDLRVGTNSSNINGKFVVRTAGGDQFFVDNAGYVGIGVATNGAEAKVHVGSGAGASLSSNGYLMLGNTSTTNVVFDNNEIQARTNGAADVLMLQRSGGTVRIGGTPVPVGYKIGIDGKVICEELKVKLASNGWPDYVFADDYKLRPLEDLEKFIRQNNHLPNIPAATELEKNGIEVGDMQKRMMEKIEEMALYIIELKKELTALKNQNK